MEMRRRLRRPTPAVSADRVGELTAYVRPKTVTSWPAAVSVTERSVANPGSNAAIMKLSVPVAKVPSAIQLSGTNWRMPTDATLVALIVDLLMLSSNVI